MSGQIALTSPFRAARPDDARLLAQGANDAGEGLAFYVWSKSARSPEAAWEIGLARARREEGSFSYRNAIVIEDRGEAAGCLIGYEIGDRPDPVPDDMPAMFRPLQELENLAPGTWYVNVVAVAASHRNRGLGSRLMSLAEKIGRARDKRGTSLLVSDANTGAMRLYDRLGYRETARRKIIKEDWDHAGRDWVLMVKPFDAASPNGS